MRVFVEAPARIHFGMLDPTGTLGRRFGGIGAAVTTPSLLLSATLSPAPADADAGVDVAVTLDGDPLAQASHTVAADGAARAAREAAARMLAHDRGRGRVGPPGRIEIRLHRLLPAHHGLGSGTQLALAAARAVARLAGLPTDSAILARIVGRGQRSAVGTYAFAHGGLIVEGGRSEGDPGPAPLLTRLAIPPSWRCVLALPPGPPGMSGEPEASAFATMATRPASAMAQEVERVAHLTLMRLLPALVDADLASFGAALTEIQRINGRWFSAAQGSTFAPGPSAALVAALEGWGATGVGQSSWGPAIYAIAGDERASATLADRIRAGFPDTVVHDTPFSDTGARVWDSEGPTAGG